MPKRFVLRSADLVASVRRGNTLLRVATLPALELPRALRQCELLVGYHVDNEHSNLAVAFDNLRAVRNKSGDLAALFFSNVD